MVFLRFQEVQKCDVGLEWVKIPVIMNDNLF